MNFFKNLNFISRKKHIGVIKFNGGINKTSADKFRKNMLKIEKSRKKIEALAFVINSTGGSAVSSNTMSSHITTFCKINNIKLFTFAENFALSGGYWLLCSGEEVYSYESSKVGSVGALMTAMDFQHFLEKKNIDRYHFTSKKDDSQPDFNKFFDIFCHKNEKDYQVMKDFIDKVHVNFKEHVLKHREGKLTKDPVELDRLFNADIVMGEEAKRLGLIDGIGDYKTVMKLKYPNLKFVDYSATSEILIKDAIQTNAKSKINSLITNAIFNH